MKRFLAILILLLVAFGVYWFVFKPKNKDKDDNNAKMTPIALKKHSDGFNASVDKAISAYLDIKNAFVEDDTLKAKESAKIFIGLLDSIPLLELKKDTASIFETAQSNLNDIKSNAQSLLAQPNITEMRHDFAMVTEMMYPSFFKAINYEGPGIYLQNCPMAFGDDQPANWISNSNEVVNPYLGKHHPEYKATMLHCGSVKDSIKPKQ
ncbi:MAG: DUF3347 domain-containing protein [Ferruginibacter sp.]